MFKYTDDSQVIGGMPLDKSNLLLYAIRNMKPTVVRALRARRSRQTAGLEFGAA